MAPETRSGRAREARASETASPPPPPPQRPRLTRAGSRGDAPPTRGRAGQVNGDVESRFQHLASSVQNDVMQLKAVTGEDEGGTPIQDLVAVVPPMTRRRAREACASETALPSLQRTRLTRGGSRGETPISGCSVDGILTGKVNEDVESRFQHLASPVQNDVMQSNRAMKASLDSATPAEHYMVTQLRATDPSLSQRTSTPMTSAQSHSLFAERQSAYMEYQRQETLAWHTSFLAHQHVAWSNNMQHVVESIAAGRAPQLQPAPEPPQLVLLTFEEFLAQHPGPSPGTSASTVGGGAVGGGAGLGTTPESRSPITPIHRGGGGGGLAGSAAASSDDLGGLGRPGA